jgi:peptidoglycan-associated lipoprotein
MKKVLLSMFIVSALVFSGCGKKKERAVEGDAKVVAATTDIPVYEYEEEKFLDADSIADFAFVDENDIVKETEELEEALAWADSEDAYEFKVVQFNLNGNSVRKDQEAVVAENLELAKEAVAEGREIVISGHCCQIGAAGYNLALSEKRAKAIKDEMVNGGIAEGKVKIVGCGSEMPVVWSDKQDKKELVEELAVNRRAEITLT